MLRKGTRMKLVTRLHPQAQFLALQYCTLIRSETWGQFRPSTIKGYHCLLLLFFHLLRMNVPVGDSRIKRTPTVNVVEAAHVVKNIA